MADRNRVPQALLTITQAAFVVRLAGLLAILLVSTGQPLSIPALAGIGVAGVISYLGLTRTDLLRRVGQHPSLALVDLAIITVPAVLSGTDSPYVLVLLPGALLLGLWIDRWAGCLVVVCLVGLYLLSLTPGSLPRQHVFVVTVVIPFVYVALWYLGLTIRRAMDREAAAQRVVHDAVASNAALGERTALAQTLHDSAAKTVQGLVLTSAALPTLIERDPARAVETARDVQVAGTQAVHELRVVMGSLRERTSTEPLSIALVQVVVSWQQRTGRVADTDIPEGVDTADESVRYEVLACVSEALDNADRHAGGCRVSVRLEVSGADWLVVEVADDGTGMTSDQADRAAAAGHFGLSGIRERMARIGGSADIDSAPDEGTTITLRVHREGLIEG